MLFAALALAAPPVADARITRIEIDTARSQSPTFGGYSWPKRRAVREDRRQGVRRGQPARPAERGHRRHRVRAAQRPRQGRVRVQLLHPEADRSYQGRGQDDVRAAQPRRQDLDRLRPRQRRRRRPGSITDPTVLANSFLMPRGYTIVWSGWEDLGPLANFGTAQTRRSRFADRQESDGSTITGPSYEYIVVGNARRSSFTLSYPAATLDKTTATLTHRVHLDDAPQVVPASGWNYNATGTAISLAGGNFVANDIYEFSYTAKDPKVNGLGFAAVRDWMEFLRYEARDDHGNAQSAGRHIKRDLHRNLVAARTYAQRLPEPRLQRRPKAAGRSSTATCSGSRRATAST